MLNKLLNEKGITLVELLATIVIVSIVAALSYSILFQGYSNYQRIKAENELRDEADLIMASLIKDIFVLKSSEIRLDKSCSSGTKQSFLTITKFGTSSSYKTGFDNGKVFVKSQQVKFYDNSVQLVPGTCTDTSPTFIEQKANSSEFNITFTLKVVKGKKDYTKKFENTITVINDAKEGA